MRPLQLVLPNTERLGFATSTSCLRGKEKCDDAVLLSMVYAEDSDLSCSQRLRGGLGSFALPYFRASVLMPPGLSSLSSPPASLDSLGPLESSPRHWTCWTFPVNPDVPISLAEILDVNSPWDLPVQSHRLLRGDLKGGSPTVNAQR